MIHFVISVRKGVLKETAEIRMSYQSLRRNAPNGEHLKKELGTAFALIPLLFTNGTACGGTPECELHKTAQDFTLAYVCTNA